MTIKISKYKEKPQTTKGTRSYARVAGDSKTTDTTDTVAPPNDPLAFVDGVPRQKLVALIQRAERSREHHNLAGAHVIARIC